MFPRKEKKKDVSQPFEIFRFFCSFERSGLDTHTAATISLPQFSIGKGKGKRGKKRTESCSPCAVESIAEWGGSASALWLAFAWCGRICGTVCVFVCLFLGLVDEKLFGGGGGGGGRKGRQTGIFEMGGGFCVVG